MNQHFIVNKEKVICKKTQVESDTNLIKNKGINDKSIKNKKHGNEKDMVYQILQLIQSLKLLNGCDSMEDQTHRQKFRIVN